MPQVLKQSLMFLFFFANCACLISTWNPCKYSRLFNAARLAAVKPYLVVCLAFPTP